MPAVEMDYTNRDYESIRTFLVNTARTMLPEWITAGEPADFGTLLLELYAYMGDSLNYYIDRVAAEPFLATAVRRQSLLAISDLLGYIPIAQQAATTILQFKLDDDIFNEDPYFIGSGTLTQTQAQRDENAIFFEVVGSLTLGGVGGERLGEVPAVEGRTIRDEFIGVSNGAPLQDFILTNSGVIERTTVISVTEANGAVYQWDYVDRLTDAQPDASVYTTYVDENFYMHARFGDAVSGRIPPVNASIYVNYRYGRGADGNVAPGVVVLLSEPESGVNVLNTIAGVGGSDPESLESMRYSIPRASRTRDRAVTLADFSALALQVPGVAKATSYGLYYTLVHVPIAAVGGSNPTEEMKNRVTAYLQDRMMIGATVLVEDPHWLPVEVAMTVNVLAAYGQASVVQSVKDAITAVFAFNKINFGVRVSIGEVFRAAVDVTGVDWIDLTLLRPKGDPATAPIDIVPSTIQLVTLADADLSVTAVGGLT